MQFCRLYTGDDNQSHFEDLDQTEAGEFVLKTLAVKGLMIKNDDNRDILGWHTAPRRQWCITLSGSCEIGVGDGTKRTFKPFDK